MSDVFRTVMMCERWLDDDDFSSIVDRYALPFVLCIKHIDRIVETSGEAVRTLGELRSDMIAAGVVRTQTTIVSQFVVEEEMAFVVTENSHLNARGGIVQKSRMSYVLRRVEDEWKIYVLSCS